MVQLPLLPATETPWSPIIRNAFSQLNSVYSTASTYLESGSVEPHRLEQYATAVVGDAFPLLLLLDESAEDEGLDLSWLEHVSNLYVELLVLLDENLARTRGEYVVPLTNLYYKAYSLEPIGKMPMFLSRSQSPLNTRDVLVAHESMLTLAS